MLVEPCDVLRAIGADLRAEKPKLTVANVFDRSVMTVIESQYDWRDLSARRPHKYQEAAE